jgi:hypothetical protein
MKPLSLAGLYLLFTLSVSCATGKKNNIANDVNTLQEALSNGSNIQVTLKTFDAAWNLTEGLKSVTETEVMNRIFVSSSITFINCTFRGAITGFVTDKAGKATALCFQKNVSFINCIFESDVNLRAAHFQSTVTFQSCSFVKTGNFEECTYMGDAYFNDTKYREAVRFQNAVFMKKANWMQSRFENQVSFQGTVFYNDAQLSTVEFQNYADFSVCTFQMGAFFNYCKFEKQADFGSCQFSKRFEMLSAKAQNINCSHVYFGMNPKMNKTEIKEKADFSNAIFISGMPAFNETICPQIVANRVTIAGKSVSQEDFIKAFGK